MVTIFYMLFRKKLFTTLISVTPEKEVWLVSVMSACNFLLVLVCDCHIDSGARWQAVLL